MNKNNYFKKTIAALLAIFITISMLVPAVSAFAATSRTPIGSTGYYRFKVNGNDSYCINVLNHSGGTSFESSKEAYDYWDDKLNKTEKDNVELAITAAHILGYYNDTNNEYLGVQRYIWHQTNPSAVLSKNIEKKDMAATQYKKVVEMVEKLKRIRGFSFVAPNKTINIPDTSTSKTVQIKPSADATTGWSKPVFTGTGKNNIKFSKSGNSATFSLTGNYPDKVNVTATFNSTIDWYGNTQEGDFYKSNQQEVYYLAHKKTIKPVTVKVLYESKPIPVKYYGSLSIAKILKYYDSDGSEKYKGLNGVRFEVESPKGTKLDEISTETINGAVGIGYIREIEVGTDPNATKTVWVKEVSSPDDSTSADGQVYHQVTIKANQNTRVVTGTDSYDGTKYVNVQHYGDLLVHKMINDIDENGKIKTENGKAVFKTPSEVYPSDATKPTFRLKLTKKDDESIVFYRNTNANGNAFFCNIPLGTYYLEEVKDDAGKVDSNGQYVNKNETTNGRQEVSIIWDGQRNYGNTAANGYNSGTGEAFQGVRIYENNDTSGNLLYINHTGVSVNNEPSIADSDVESISGETEQYGETELNNDDYSDAGDVGDDNSQSGDDNNQDTPSGDSSDESSEHVTYGSGGQQSSVISGASDNGLFSNYYNATKQWYAEFKKVDSKTLNTARGHGSLQGAVYGLYRKYNGETKKVAEYTTDTNGKFTTEAYTVIGDYYVKEITPSKGYKMDTTEYPVFSESLTDVSSWGEITKLSRIEGTESNLLPEDGIEGKIDVFKYDADYPENKLSGAEFAIFDDVNENGIFDDNDVEMSSLVETETGYYVSEVLPYGHYLVKETKAPTGYNVDNNYYPVYIQEDGKTYTVKNNGTCFVDNPIKGKIDVYKYDADYPENKLSGAEFTVYKDTNANGEYDTDEPEVTKLTESETGLYSSSNIRYGHYLVKETKAPTGFIADNNYYSVFISENGKIYNIKNNSKGFMNTAVKGYIDVLKFDKDYPDNKLSGAEFTVYKDSNANGEHDAGETEVVKLSAVENQDGYYKSTAIRYGHYLVKETKAPTGFVIDNNYYPVFINENNKTYSVKNNSKGFMNTAIKGRIDLNKLDADNSENKLSGAEFTVYKDVNGNGIYDNDDAEIEKLGEESIGYYKSTLLWSDKKRNIFGLPWTFTNYFLTDNKLIIKSGVFTITKNEIDLYRITDKKVVQPLLGRFFGYGSLVLYSRDTNNSIIELKNIANPELIADKFSDCIDKERDKYNIRGKDMYGSGYYTKK